MSDVFENLKALSRIAEEKLETEIEEKKISPSNHSALNTGLNVKGQEKWSQPDVHNNTAREINLNYINKNKKLRGKFPMKLYNLLSRDEYKDLICWNDSGAGWKVMEQRAFEKVLPQYFKHESFDSFMRQVYTWGFKRIKQGPNIGCYSHPLFQRDKVIPFDEIRPLLYKCKTTKAKSSRAKPRQARVNPCRQVPQSALMLSSVEDQAKADTSGPMPKMSVCLRNEENEEHPHDFPAPRDFIAPIDLTVQSHIQNLQHNDMYTGSSVSLDHNTVDRTLYPQMQRMQSLAESNGNTTSQLSCLSQPSTSSVSQLSQLQHFNTNRFLNSGQLSNFPPYIAALENSRGRNHHDHLERLNLFNANNGGGQFESQQQISSSCAPNNCLPPTVRGGSDLNNSFQCHHHINRDINEQLGILNSIQRRIEEIHMIQELLNRERLLNRHQQQQQQQQQHIGVMDDDLQALMGSYYGSHSDLHQSPSS